MDEGRYELTAAQAAFLEAARRTPSAGRASSRAARIRVPGPLPPVSDQAVRGTCVASAVAALVACYEGCRRRVSVQYLDEVTRLVEQAWVTRNLKCLVEGVAPEKDFEASFPEAVSQATLLVRANGAGSESALAFVRALGTKIRARIEADAGCRLKRCFEALEEYGVCREELWPYSPVALNAGASGGDAVGAFPPGTHEDARRHRIVNGLYVLRSPNNVDEIKGILSGARGRRPMPVCAGLDLFEGRTDGTFELPSVQHAGGKALVAERSLGIHEVLLIASTDDAESPGGGYFTFQNSWGRAWGEDGTGRVSHAYVACFCREAGTILQEPDDYGPGVALPAKPEAQIIARRRATMICAVAICLAAMTVSVFIAVWSLRAGGRKAEARLARQSAVSAPDFASQRPPRHASAAKNPVPRAVSGDGPEEAETLAVVRLVGYRYRMRGLCGSAAEARAMAKILAGTHREVSFGEIRVDEEGRYFEGEASIEGLEGRPPHAIQAVEEYLKRKRIESAVRKWSVRRLR